jgi:NADH-quinone oxidoreductase subunit N
MHALAQFSASQFNPGLIYAGPEIFLALAACAILMLDLLLNDAQRRWTGVWAVAALLITAGLVAQQPVSGRIVALGGLFELDRMAQVLKVVTLLTVAVVFVYSTDYLQRRAILKGEYYVLGLFAALGAMVLTSAASLISLYLGLELMSLCLYAMVAFDRESPRSPRPRTTDWETTSVSCSASRFSSSAWASNSEPFPSTCGYRTCMKARRHA